MPPFTTSTTLFLACLFACKESESGPPPQAPPPTEVTVTAVALQEITPSDELTGRVEAVHQVDVRPRVSGYVTQVHYKEGSEVATGAVLFSIDARPYLAALARANAELARTKARLELAQTEAKRAEQLLAQNAIARAERDTAVSSVTQIEAEIAAARATVQLAQLDVEFTRVRAPQPGRTGQALVSVGDFVAAGPQTLLTTLVSVDPVYVYFTGDEQRYLRFTSRDDARTVSVGLADEDGYPHAGKVDFIDNRIDAQTGTIRVRAVVPNPDKRLVPGLYARVRLPDTAPVKAVLIDDKAILTDQDRKYVYVLAADGTVARHDVKLGRIVDGQRVITNGLAAGDRVIVGNIQKVYPGAKATVAVAVKP